MSIEPEDSIDLYERPDSPYSVEYDSMGDSDRDFIDDSEVFPPIYEIGEIDGEQEEEIFWSTESDSEAEEEVDYDIL